MSLLKKIALPSASIPWVLLVLLAIGNVGLIAHNLKLRNTLRSLTALNILTEKKRVSSFTGVQLDGASIEIAYGVSQPRRLFLFFTLNCPYCREQFKYWKEVGENAERGTLSVVGVVSETESSEKVRDYLKSIDYTELNVARVSNVILQDYKLSRSPITLLVSRDGIVEGVWLGKWTPQMLSEIKIKLGLKI